MSSPEEKKPIIIIASSNAYKCISTMSHKMIMLHAFYHLTSFHTTPTQVLITISSILMDTKSLETFPSTPGSTKSY